MFLTLEDPRAKIKGSRDPLGVQPIWSAFGRHVVTNLTTVTNSVRGFTVLLLGRYFGERLLEAGRIEQEELLDVFLRTEQVSGYARYIVHGDEAQEDGRILGIDRVSRRVAESPGTVPIQASATATILSDQKTYGLWGLFTVSSRVSGLLPDGPIGVTQPAREFIEEHYLPHLKPVLSRVDTLLQKGGSLSTRKNDPIVAAFGRILSRKLSTAEREFYGSYLRDAEHRDRSEDDGHQATFRRLLEQHTDLAERTVRTELESMERAAKKADKKLAVSLRRILDLEALLAPCEAVFGLLQTRHGQKPARVAAALTELWGKGVPNLDQSGFDAIRGEIAKGIKDIGEDITVDMARVHAALASGTYREAIETLLEWNRTVMARRGAAPWVRLAPDGTLDVRYRGTEGELPSREELPTLWRNSYFIDSLKAITAQISGNVGKHAA